MEGLPEYHPDSDVRGLDGFHPNLSQAQVAAVEAVMSALAGDDELRQGVRRFSHGEPEELMAMRFLRARRWQPQAALEMLRADVAWRESERVHELWGATAEEVLECPLEATWEWFPTFLQGHDRQQRPVSYTKYGNCAVSAMKGLTSLERWGRYHTWTMEATVLALRRASAASGVNVESFTAVMDATGWSMRLATRDAYKFLRGMAETDSAHYPERLGKLVVINAPSALAVAWRVVKGWLDSRTREKISILAGEEEWGPLLRELVDHDQLPEAYGGGAPEVGPEELKGLTAEGVAGSVRRGHAAHAAEAGAA